MNYQFIKTMINELGGDEIHQSRITGCSKYFVECAVTGKHICKRKLEHKIYSLTTLGEILLEFTSEESYLDAVRLLDISFTDKCSSVEHKGLLKINGDLLTHFNNNILLTASLTDELKRLSKPSDNDILVEFQIEELTCVKNVG